MTNRKINDTYELWTFLKTEGGFDTKNYDKAMFTQLMSAFKISSEKDFETALKQWIKQEDFIVNFFQLLQPFSLMISDILSLFAKYEIKESNNNFEILFNSSQMKKELSFNISNFIEYQKIVQKVISGHKEYIDNLGKVARKMWNMYKHRKSNIPEFLHWNETYTAGIYIPEFKFEWIPLSENKKFDKLVSEIFDVWDEIKKILQSIAPTREERMSIYHKGNSQYQEILQSETDYWLRNILNQILTMAEDYPTMNEKEQNHICNIVNDILKVIDKKSYQKEISVKSLQEILKLPVWKHRYEVYSIWVFSQIIEALSTLNVRIISENGKLSFSFSGRELASINNSDCCMKLWSELRTECIVPPVSKKRKNNIQPDYSIIKDLPKEDANSSILVVECKQYKKQSLKNFSEAIIDYANNRPKADIFLVNYGEMEKGSVLSAVEKKISKDIIQDRISIFSELRPDKQEKDVFKKAVKYSIFKYICKNIKFTDFKLEWNEVPKDLDLHLFFYPKGSNDVKKLSYNENQITTAKISEDITSGFGPESIHITHWEEGVYYLSVHNYSKDAPLADCKGKLTCSSEVAQQEFICPEQGNGDWWNIIEIDTTNGKFNLINKIEDSPIKYIGDC